MAEKLAKPHPDFPMPHPGALLAADVEALAYGKAELARRLGISRKALYDILNEQCAITATMAVKLEAVLGSSAEMWLGMQMQHDLWRARQAKKPGRASRKAA